LTVNVRETLVRIRAADTSDNDAIWRVLEPMIRAGETYPLPRDMTKPDALAYWNSPRHEVYVAEEGAEILGISAGEQRGWRRAFGQLRLCGRAGIERARRRPRHVRAFARARQGAGLSRHAVQFRHQLERARGAAVA